MVAAGEWLRAPSRPAALAGIALLFLAAFLARRRRTALLFLLPAAALGVAEWRVEGLETGWAAARERRIEAASARLADELQEARLLADRLAHDALGAADQPPEAGFHSLGALVQGNGLEAGVAVLEPAGGLRVWGGRFRLEPEATGDSVSVRLTPYYAVLEVRRHAPSGRVGIGAVLLAAHPAVPDQAGSLAARFRERTEVGLRILSPRGAPDNSDVFDYEQPTTAGSRVLFSAQLVPPEQSEAISRAERSGRRGMLLALLVALIGALTMAPAGPLRLALALLPAVVALRAPLTTILALPASGTPVFRSDILGPVSATPGRLAITGLVLFGIGVLLWERRLPRRLPGIIAGLVLLAGAPYLLGELGRGILPPADGVSTGLWLGWHLCLFLLSAGLITLGAALLRGPGPGGEGWVAPVLGGLLAQSAALVGVLVWNARYGWPDWYTVLWIPPLLLVTRPARRRAMVAGVALVAGSATALVAWGATVEGRLTAARADMAAVGDSGPVPPGAALRAFGDSLRGRRLPASLPELYALWATSGPAQLGAPAALGVWSDSGIPRLELPLNELDLPREVVSAMVRSIPADSGMLEATLARVPGNHRLLLVRGDSGSVLSVALGPGSGLVRRSRLGRLLSSASPRTPLYRLTVAPAPSDRPPDPGDALWRREGWSARGERTALIAGVPRRIFGRVDLGSPQGLLVRGALVVILDTALLALLWSLVALGGGLGRLWPAWMPRLRSWEARLWAALAVFFLAPTVGFAAWGVGRLRSEERTSRDRVIEQSLRDVLPPAEALSPPGAVLEADLRAMSARVDADFELYAAGRRLAGSNGGLLEMLGLMPPLMDADAYHRIAIDGEASAAASGPSRVVATRVGYRAVSLDDQGAAVLAVPQVAADAGMHDRQVDLALVLLLATLLGVGASLLAARTAARVLSRPVARLRDAAVAFGRGEDPVALPTERPPAEFAPVFAAFQRMTADVRKAREAQERAARIVAWGEMATQVAHEIKNPLTPMRLGVQHLRRVYHDGRTPIGPVLEDTTGRILSEIDRLDRIARSFSRFGTPASDRGPLEAVRLPRVVREVAELYRLGPEGAEIVVVADEGGPVQARSDEVKEALVNLLENSRNAEARTITIRVAGTTLAVEDDGKGIPAALLPLIFEPRFSTSTSGSGLGLAIVKRLVEGWGGRVEVASEEGKGTAVRLVLLAAAEGGPVPAPQGDEEVAQ